MINKFLAALGAALLIATPMSAATVNGISGIVYEGGVKPAADAPKPPNFNLGDFNSNPGDPTLIIVGDTSIYGGVAHRRATKYYDSWTMDFGSRSYEAVFNWKNVTDLFDGRITVGGTEYELGTAGSVDLGRLSGVVTFVLDPIYGEYGPNPDEVATWDLQTTAVPVPAGVVLLLTGLGGLAVARRRLRT